ncbi:hypothetical protein B0H10DRAFT_1231673 [Mycena sp. CBHHK59/15]|nr:hypothetical protein B0H10DRAFT_1231673 [Mycena sp. CBHHK59/15]
MSFALVSIGILLVLGFVLAARRQSYIGNIAGPPSPSWIFGNFAAADACPMLRRLRIQLAKALWARLSDKKLLWG